MFLNKIIICFGMKEARVRVKTAQGTNLNHAYYKTWQKVFMIMLFINVDI
jgi:hypothetical protein